MQRVRVKIEGVRDAPTAVKVAQMGADAVGMVFAESPRWVSPEQARDIVAALPPFVAAVGVFVDADAATINRVIERTGIGFVQLHGSEPPELVGQVRVPCIKAFKVRDESWLAEVRAWLTRLDELGLRSHLTAVLVDSHSPKAAGGTGQRFNWDLVADARIAGAMKGLDPIILAGGLDASCVETAIQAVKPWAVDVASGVEKAPGVKDLRKVADFIQATREGDEIKSEFWVGR